MDICSFFLQPGDCGIPILEAMRPPKLEVIHCSQQKATGWRKAPQVFSIQSMIEEAVNER